jgi:hypothetical protein
MRPLRWTREHCLAFLATMIFGACLGVVGGMRRVDPVVNQNLYWLWLGVWIASGLVLGAIGAYIQLLRRS